MMRQFLISALFSFSLLTAAPRPAQARGGSMEGPCNEAVSGVRALTASLKFPDHLLDENAVRRASDFDVMEYFTVLDYLSMEEGYVLDYVYFFDFMGGFPVLYARPEDQEPYASYAGLMEAYPDGETGYLDHIVVEDVASGYFQLAVLSVMGEQFYLHWHANYNDYRFVCDEEALEAILTEYEPGAPLAIPEEVIEQAGAIDVLPWAAFHEEYVEVSAVGFTAWGGFSRTTYQIQREFPHTFTYQTEKLVEYVTPLMF